MRDGSVFGVHRVLFATDMSDSSVTALSYAAGLAKKYGATLIVVHVLDTSGAGGLADASGMELRSLVESTRNELKLSVENWSQQEFPTEVLVRYGNVPDSIFQIQREYAVDILVLGSSGRKIGRGPRLGSIAEAILRSMPCSVLTVGPGVQHHIFSSKAQRIVFPTDFSEVSLAAFPLTTSFAASLSANLILLHVFDQNSLQFGPKHEATCKRKLEELLAAVADPTIVVESAVMQGDVAASIVSCAQRNRADFIVMGVHGGDLNDGTKLHGKIQHVIRSARCPVLTLMTPAYTIESKASAHSHTKKEY